MASLVADTHAVIWYLFGSASLSAAARAAMDAAIQGGGSIFVATISLVEAAYLIEKGRIPAVTFDRMDLALSDPASGFAPVPLEQEVARALRGVPRNLVPDMPDRIIAATAVHLNLPLVTADHKIQTSGIATIW